MRLSEVPLLTEDQIRQRVRSLSQEINVAYKGAPVTLVVLLNGAFVFAADLARGLAPDAEIAFLRAKSYAGAQSTGRVRFTLNPELDLAGRRVLLVDDILDTGRTTAAACERLRQADPAELRVCALLDKPSRRVVNVEADFVGFRIEDEFVVGYGLDYEERYRGLPAIYVLR